MKSLNIRIILASVLMLWGILTIMLKLYFGAGTTIVCLWLLLVLEIKTNEDHRRIAKALNDHLNAMLDRMRKR